MKKALYIGMPFTRVPAVEQHELDLSVAEDNEKVCSALERAGVDGGGAQ